MYSISDNLALFIYFFIGTLIAVFLPRPIYISKSKSRPTSLFHKLKFCISFSFIVVLIINIIKLINPSINLLPISNNKTNNQSYDRYEIIPFNVIQQETKKIT